MRQLGLHAAVTILCHPKQRSKASFRANGSGTIELMDVSKHHIYRHPVHQPHRSGSKL